MEKSYINELIVVKVGTSSLEHQNINQGVALAQHQFSNIALQTDSLIRKGAHVAIVSSAAIAAGHQVTQTSRSYEIKQNTLEQQRLALIGQSRLMREWTDAFDFVDHDKRNVGQALFTRNELRTNEASELAAVALYAMDQGDVVIANENDALSHEEISFGDNDQLAAHFAVLLQKFGLFKRTHLVMLTNRHGVYADKDNWSTLIPEISSIDDYRHVAGGSDDLLGTGGMESKFAAAEIATSSGIDTYITHGTTDATIERALLGEIGTRFVA